jgi:hypothetical protein
MWPHAASVLAQAVLHFSGLADSRGNPGAFSLQSGSNSFQKIFLRRHTAR